MNGRRRLSDIPPGTVVGRAEYVGAATPEFRGANRTRYCAVRCLACRRVRDVAATLFASGKAGRCAECAGRVSVAHKTFDRYAQEERRSSPTPRLADPRWRPDVDDCGCELEAEDLNADDYHLRMQARESAARMSIPYEGDEC